MAQYKRLYQLEINPNDQVKFIEYQKELETLSKKIKENKKEELSI